MFTSNQALEGLYAELFRHVLCIRSIVFRRIFLRTVLNYLVFAVLLIYSFVLLRILLYLSYSS